MLHGRKGFEVTGYAPADAGYVLCVPCHKKKFPDHDPDDCTCGAEFISTETESVQYCDDCGEEIETTVVGGEDTWPRWDEEHDVPDEKE
jgi:hypothetical protein